LGAVFNLELVTIGPGVNDRDGEVAGIALLLIFAQVSQSKSRSPGNDRPFPRPDNLVKAAQAAVKMIPVVVSRQRIRLAVEREPAFGNPVTISSDDWAQVGRISFVTLDVVIAKGHIAQPSFVVANLN
jgi:hypothetical protein